MELDREQSRAVLRTEPLTFERHFDLAVIAEDEIVAGIDVNRVAARAAERDVVADAGRDRVDAAHPPEASAGAFIEFLCSLAPVVLF